MVLCLVTLTDLETRRAGLSASSELLVLPARRSKRGTSYGNVAGWLSVTAGIVSK